MEIPVGFTRYPFSFKRVITLNVAGSCSWFVFILMTYLPIFDLSF